MTKSRDILTAGEGVGNDPNKEKDDSIGQIGADTIEGFLKLKEEFLACVENEESLEKRYDMLLTYVKVTLSKMETYLEFLRKN